jgi:hypothetical protein
MKEELEKRIEELEFIMEEICVDSQIKINAREKLQVLNKFHDAMYGIN